MAITTNIARHYSIRLIVMAVLMVVMTIWGGYDLFVKIPREEQVAARYQELIAERASLEERGTLTDTETTRYEAIEQEVQTLAPGGKVPEAPAAYDKPLQWLFISCILFAPYFVVKYRQVSKRVYRLDDDGTLHTPEASWTREQIVGIDMSRWMAKSIATVEIDSGEPIPLDAYLYADMHLIVGAIAHRFHPEQWHEDARQVKAVRTGDDGDDDTPSEPADAEDTARSAEARSV